MKSSNRTVLWAFGAAFVILLVVGAFSYRSMVVSGKSDRLVRHTHEVLENLQQLLFAVTKVEWSVRGFVLTGEESYLEAYRAGKSSAEQRPSPQTGSSER